MSVLGTVICTVFHGTLVSFGLLSRLLDLLTMTVLQSIIERFTGLLYDPPN